MDQINSVHLRFAPAPNGHLHIGHIKTIWLNKTFCEQNNGTLTIRFDDTNPAKDDQKYVDSILNDLKVLEIDLAKITYTSDYFANIHNYAWQLINMNLAYVDDTSADEMKRQRLNNLPNNNRNQSIEFTTEIFQKMLIGNSQTMNYCLRAKINMQANNAVLRDPVIYRNTTVHHKKVPLLFGVCLPTYDFASCIVDSIENISHVMRANEFRDRNELYLWFCDKLNLKQPIFKDFSKLGFSHTILSKRYLNVLVETNLVSGWDDARMPTLCGLVKRGLTTQAIKEFMSLQGFAQIHCLMQYDKIWNINSKIIDEFAHRHTVLVFDNTNNPLQKINIRNLQNLQQTSLNVEVKNHPKKPDLGVRQQSISNDIFIEKYDANLCKSGELITLLNFGNILVEECQTSQTNKSESKIICQVHKIDNKEIMKSSRKLTWINTLESIACKLIVLANLLTVPSIKNIDELEIYFNHNSWTSYSGVAEMSLKYVSKNSIVQLNRRGYAIVYSTWPDLQLILIPTGKKSNFNLPFDLQANLD